MPFNFIATEDFDKSISDVNILIHFANEQKNAGNEDNRMLFLKLSVVLSVTKFQVFIEGILKEYQYHLKTSNKHYHQVSIFLRLNSIKLFTTQNIIHKALENPETFNPNKLAEVKEISKKVLAFCDDNGQLDATLEFDTKFPMGKTGLGELSKLFKQVNGEDIFENTPFDINKLNEILGRRHAIIHEDTNPQITEDTVEKYRDYLIVVVNYIDNYLQGHK